MATDDKIKATIVWFIKVNKHNWRSLPLEKYCFSERKKVKEKDSTKETALQKEHNAQPWFFTDKYACRTGVNLFH
jgi:hypothetical protein